MHVRFSDWNASIRSLYKGFCFVLLFCVVSVVVWDLEKKDAVCGSPAAMRSAGQARVVAYCCDDDERFLTGGE